MPGSSDFEKHIFINCPFDSEYKKMRDALLFTIIRCGFRPNIASENLDSGLIRFQKISKLIKESKYSIHDISRTELSDNDLPRFNMPIELGLDVGARTFSNGPLKSKKCLILGKEKYSYQSFISDMSGNDIEIHNSDPETLVYKIRTWINSISNGQPIGSNIWNSYNDFSSKLNAIFITKRYTDKDKNELGVKEYIAFIDEYLKDH